MSHVLLIIGLLLFAYACRTFSNRFLSKLSWITVMAATYLVAYFLTDKHGWGIFALSLWFIFPWIEILGRVRSLRFPLRSDVKHRFPPSREIFPDLDAISNEVEEAGFEKTDDAGWKWEETDHFVRLFYNEEQKMQAAISVAQQGDFVYSHASLTTRTTGGISYTTTNYPFSFTMKSAPQQRMNRCENADTFDEMMESHRVFLSRQGAAKQEISQLDPQTLHTTISEDLGIQIDHNLNAGVIVRADEEHFRYSWRGCWFLWIQVVKDMIRG